MKITVIVKCVVKSVIILKKDRHTYIIIKYEFIFFINHSYKIGIYLFLL